MSRPVRPPKRRPHLASSLIGTATGVLVVALVVAGFAGWAIAWESTENTDSCTVMSTDRATTVRDGESRSDMRVYTDCGTFAVADDSWQRQWSSADTFGSIQPGHTYRLHSIGWRFPFLSIFPNILWTQELHGE